MVREVSFVNFSLSLLATIALLGLRSKCDGLTGIRDGDHFRYDVWPDSSTHQPTLQDRLNSTCSEEGDEDNCLGLLAHLRRLCWFPYQSNDSLPLSRRITLNLLPGKHVIPVSTCSPSYEIELTHIGKFFSAHHFGQCGPDFQVEGDLRDPAAAVVVVEPFGCVNSSADDFMIKHAQDQPNVKSSQPWAVFSFDNSPRVKFSHLTFQSNLPASLSHYFIFIGRIYSVNVLSCHFLGLARNGGGLVFAEKLTSNVRSTQLDIPENIYAKQRKAPNNDAQLLVTGCTFFIILSPCIHRLPAVYLLVDRSSDLHRKYEFNVRLFNNAFIAVADSDSVAQKTLEGTGRALVENIGVEARTDRYFQAGLPSACHSYVILSYMYAIGLISLGAKKQRSGFLPRFLTFLLSFWFVVVEKRRCYV